MAISKGIHIKKDKSQGMLAVKHHRNRLKNKQGHVTRKDNTFAVNSANKK